MSKGYYSHSNVSFVPWSSPWNQQSRDIKKKSMTNAMTSLFQSLTSLLSVAIFQHHQRIEFTHHISYVILELVSSAVVFWSELSCCRKNYSNKVALLLRWDHRCKHYIMKFGTFLPPVVCWGLMSDICYLCLRIVVSWVACLVSYKRWELLTLSGHLCSPMFLVGSVLLIFLVFCVVCFVLLVFLLCPVLCVHNVASCSGLFILDCPFGCLLSVFTWNIWLVLNIY
jgi:hypothetical protein